MIRNKFTLIELMVVVAIIAILASMLLPALGKGRRTARKVVCVSNLKNIGYAFTMYVGDEDQYPRYPVGTWTDYLGDPTTWGYVGRPLNPYVGGNFDIAECPSDKGVETNWGPTQFSVYVQDGNSYKAVAYNHTRTSPSLSNSGDSITNSPPVKANAFMLSPSNKIITGDSPWQANASTSLSINQWHSKRYQYNMLFADGHAVFTTFPTDLEDNQHDTSAGDPNSRWW